MILGSKNSDQDPLYNKVKRYCRKMSDYSNITIQNKFNIGYLRAEKILNALENHYYEKAKRIALRTGEARAIKFKRRFRIGYSFAFYLCDLLEAQGIVTSENRTPPYGN